MIARLTPAERAFLDAARDAENALKRLRSRAERHVYREVAWDPIRRDADLAEVRRAIAALLRYPEARP